MCYPSLFCPVNFLPSPKTQTNCYTPILKLATHVSSPFFLFHWTISTVLCCQFQSSSHHVSWSIVVFSAWIFVISLSSLQTATNMGFDYRTACSLPRSFSKHGFSILFHFRNKHLLDVHLIILSYKGSDLLRASQYLFLSRFPIVRLVDPS